MAMDLILKIFGLGMFINIIITLLEQSGRKELSQMVILIGVIVALMIVMPQLSRLINTAVSLFGF